MGELSSSPMNTLQANRPLRSARTGSMSKYEHGSVSIGFAKCDGKC